MNKASLVQKILGERFDKAPKSEIAKAFAPSNIALCKYWGKRNQELNLPVTSSLSVGLGDKGAEIQLQVADVAQDIIMLNDCLVEPSEGFSKRLIEFLNLFRTNDIKFKITIHSNIPIAAGLASSAAGFASVVRGLNSLYEWNLQPHELSILARMGSGSASRSIWPGFVEWQKGECVSGMDSHGVPIDIQWPELCIGLVIVSEAKKPVSSRVAMQRTVETSTLYQSWPAKVDQDLALIKHSLANKDFSLLGQTSESNALAMHATMLNAWPPVSYLTSETLTAMQKIWRLREEGLNLYFTQDAGPNLKLLFLRNDTNAVTEQFPQLEIISPFFTNNSNA